MKIRPLFFWSHLVIGLGLGLVIFSMCVSGTMLAFEPQLTARAERALQTVIPPVPIAQRLDAETLLARASAAHPDGHPSMLTIKADPTAAVQVGFGRDGLFFLNPYTGDVIGRSSKTRQFLHSAEEWHRWLGNKEIGSKVTAAAAFAFCLLSLSGVYLWWPRRTYTLTGHAKARDWNWHNTFGLSAAPFILIITVTGILMSSGLSKPPMNHAHHRDQDQEPLTLEALLKKARDKNPSWTSVTLRLPQRAEQSPTVFVQPPAGPKPWQSWVVPLHTGRAWGIPGQALNVLVALCGILQIWTGFALSWRRIRAERERRQV